MILGGPVPSHSMHRLRDAPDSITDDVVVERLKGCVNISRTTSSPVLSTQRYTMTMASSILIGHQAGSQWFEWYLGAIYPRLLPPPAPNVFVEMMQRATPDCTVANPFTCQSCVHIPYMQFVEIDTFSFQIIYCSDFFLFIVFIMF
jgi:hypothetical protein